VSLPGSVQQWGYTPEAFAQRVSDRTQEIALNAKRDFDEAYPRRWIGTQAIEAKIPGSDFTTRSAAQFISDVLALPSNRITGSVTKTDNVFDISLRVTGGEHLVAKVASTGDTADADAIVKASSELAMKLIYPYVLAASLYNDERAAKSSNFARTIGVLDDMIKSGKEIYYAHNLKCAAFLRLNKTDQAQAECEQSIAIDPTNWPARANMGNLYYSLARINPRTGEASKEAKENCRKADEQFTEAEKSHKLNKLYDSWAKCLDALGRQDQANQLRQRLENKS
jgi:tetratricopeptide (TPR) repeat protein